MPDDYAYSTCPDCGHNLIEGPCPPPCPTASQVPAEIPDLMCAVPRRHRDTGKVVGPCAEGPHYVEGDTWMCRRGHPLGSVGAAPLDPKVRAEQRRQAGDEQQLAWDATTDAARMLHALLEHERDPMVLLPPAKFIEKATKRFEEYGKQVAPSIWNQTMQCCVKRIARGDFTTAVIFLRHAYTGAGLANIADAQKDMADIVREFFPCAPPGWTVYGEGVLQKALPLYKQVRRITGGRNG